MRAGKKIIVARNASVEPVTVHIAGGGTYELIRTEFNGKSNMASKGLFEGWATLPPDSLTTLVQK